MMPTPGSHGREPSRSLSRRTWMRWASGLCATAAGLSGSAEDSPSGRRLGVEKVLFLGNSITLHGPAPQIGWTGNWGMAASRMDLDYVHLLMDKVRQHASTEPKSLVKNIAEFERQLDQYSLSEQLKSELDFRADLVIVAIGENVSALDTEEKRTRFTRSMDSLLSALQEGRPKSVLVRSCFWPDTAKDSLLKAACEKAHAVWVDMSDIGMDSANAARAERQIEHAGVAGHPGDRGMQQIADRLWDTVKHQKGLWLPG